MCLINIYAPNTDTPHFFQEINILIEENTKDHVFLCEDRSEATGKVLTIFLEKEMKIPKKV